MLVAVASETVWCDKCLHVCGLLIYHVCVDGVVERVWFSKSRHATEWVLACHYIPGSSRLATDGQLKSTACYIDTLAVSHAVLYAVFVVTAMFIVLSSWYCCCKSSFGSFDKCSTAPGSHQPLDQASRHEPLIWQAAAIVAIVAFTITSPKADRHFAIPLRVEGWVDPVADFILRWFTCLQTSK